MADEKSDPIDAAHQVVVLAFDLVDAEIEKFPGQVADALQSPQVQQEIKKTLLNFAKANSDPSKMPTNADGEKLLEALGTGIQDAATKQILEQIKKSSQFKKLEGSVDAFKAAAASSTLGVWVDKNKKILYVVGAALVVGTASVLYITKTGGSLLNTAMDPLKDKEFEVLQIGSFKLKAGVIDFQPDARVLGARVSARKEWSKLTLELKLGILAKGADVQQVQGAALLKSGSFSVTLTGEGKPQVHQVNFGVKLDYEGVLDNGKFKIGVGAMYKDEAVNGTLGASFQTKNATFGLQGNVGPKQGGGVQGGGLLTLTIPL